MVSKQYFGIAVRREDSLGEEHYAGLQQPRVIRESRLLSLSLGYRSASQVLKAGRVWRHEKLRQFGITIWHYSMSFIAPPASYFFS